MAPKRSSQDASDDEFTVQARSAGTKKPKTETRVAALKQSADERNTVDTRSQLKKLTEDNKRLNRELRILQSKLPLGALSGTNFVQGQSEIVKTFCALKKKIHDFAANHALAGQLTHHLSSENVDAMIRILSGQHSSFQYQALTKLNKAPLFSSLIGGPRVATQAIIEHLVAYEILTRPLHFLPVPVEEAFLQVAGRMKASEYGNLYMGKAVRAIYEDPEQYTGTLFKHIVADPFEGSRKAYYSHLTEVCLDGDTGLLKLLLKSSDEKTAERHVTLLRGIFMAAGKLSLQMCVQNILVMSHGLIAVRSDSCFQPGPQNLEWHTIVKSEAGDTALYRNNIGLVVSPQLTYARIEASGRLSTAITVRKGEVVSFFEEKLFPEKGMPVAHDNKPKGPIVSEPSTPPATTSSPLAAVSTLGGPNDTAARRAKDEDETKAPHVVVP